MTAIFITRTERASDRETIIQRLSGFPGYEARDNEFFLIQADLPEAELRNQLIAGITVPPDLRIVRMTELRRT